MPPNLTSKSKLRSLSLLSRLLNFRERVESEKKLEKN